MFDEIGAEHDHLLALHAVQDALIFDHDLTGTRVRLSAQDSAKIDGPAELTRQAWKIFDLFHGLLSELDGQRHKTSAFDQTLTAFLDQEGQATKSMARLAPLWF